MTGIQDHNYQIVKELLRHADVTINGDQASDIQVHNSDFFKRVLKYGSLGLGESYMDAWWDCAKLDVFFAKVFSAKLEHKLPKSIRDMVRLVGFKIRNKQSKKKAKQVAEEHYDLGNDLFALMLDPYMQYSCGYWRDPSIQTLAQAQEAKLDLICQKLHLESGMKVLDIGCGWGGLAQYAAQKYGVIVDGLTISEEQAAMARTRCQEFNVNILVKDYRDIQGRYDRVVSVGMFEHVGPKNYPQFFNKVGDVLGDDGIFLLHTIGSNQNGLHNDGWMDKYVFANGVIPTATQIIQSAEGTWKLEDWHNFGPDYDLTLMAWQKNFTQHWAVISEAYGPRFYRMFVYYLNSCAALFRTRGLQLWQIVLSKIDATHYVHIPR